MDTKGYVVPRMAIQSIATGLFLMAVFTTIWAMIAFGGLNGRDHYIEIAVFGTLAVAFFANGIYFLTVAKRFPNSMSQEDAAEGKKSGKWFGIIFGAEGLGIFLGINIVVNLGYPDLTIPVIALVVGLHFYPLGWVFKRKLDYYLATWATAVAICGFAFSVNKIMVLNDMLAFVGIGLAIATSSYGLVMIREGRRLMRMAGGVTVVTN